MLKIIILWIFVVGRHASVVSLVTTVPPNIIIIIADDLGWNDIGFHGSNEIPTPNIDALAYNGIILNRHYVLPTCTPSRAALMTGKYPIRMGMQGAPIFADVPIGLPLQEIILPQYLNKFGYVKRLLGKWHLGYYKVDHTPLKRGFDSHFGYYNGWVRYNESIVTTNNTWGKDARDGFNKAGDRLNGKYATDVYTEEAVKIITTHDTSKPLFLDVSHVAVHACFNGDLQVRNIMENDRVFSYIQDPRRRLFAGMLSALDESVGKIIAALDERNMLNNSIVLFMSDNGGATHENQFPNTGSNWPLRGRKSSLVEGGVRGAAAVWSPFFTSSNVTNELFHITDWLPTFYAAAGGRVSDLGKIDGINQWDYLTGKRKSSSRKEVLININEVTNDSAIIADGWKYIQINSSALDYAGSPGRDNLPYNIADIMRSNTNKILQKYSRNTETEDSFLKLREQSIIDNDCKERIEVASSTDYNYKLKCFRTGCLFNIKDDPCEFNDLSENMKSVVSNLGKKLNVYRKELVKQIKAKPDPRSDPARWDNYWSPWIIEHQVSSSSDVKYRFINFLSIISLYLIVLVK